MNKEREICGVKVIVSGETYNEYKGTLQEQLEEKDKEIERLSKEVDMWNKKYNEQFDIINELEKWLKNLMINNQSDIRNNHYSSDEWKDTTIIDNILYKMKPISIQAQETLDKLKELKEGK